MGTLSESDSFSEPLLPSSMKSLSSVSGSGRLAACGFESEGSEAVYPE